ncbi:MAG: hypothetical protein AAGB31_14500, partial [Bdellovibrio sp.]
STLALPINCALEQIAIFHDSDSEFIELQTDLWQRLPALHRAALIVHELIYKSYRLLGDRSSEFTRLQVAQLFSEEGKSVLRGLPTDVELCTAYSTSGNETTKFFIYSTSSSLRGTQWFLQFTQLMGRPLVTKTFITLSTAFPRMSQINTFLGNSIFPVVSDREVQAAEFYPLQGVGYDNWTIKIDWSPKKPVSIALYNGRELQQETYFWGCKKEQP